ncbi:molybdenum cofactor guanylyltransferase MobA [Salinicola avicenniae]|uniref:molybdenum cofactor guanylyltransferase MobA n=1 Tax=Salinicola avicenniae TaxID=2916836 RepID=UPI002073A06D|nr:molybdenum cofactor guanylyltransferase MobA [Salinicola sp. S1-1-8]
MTAVTGVLLAGGRGQRMGGIDKGWALWQGEPLVVHALGRLRSQVHHVVISANRHHARYAALGHAVVADTLPDFAGPLSGVLAGMGEAQDDWLFVMPVDMPAVPFDTLARLQGAMGSGDIVSVHDGAHRQPLVALIRRSLREDLAQWLADGGRRPIDWYARHDWHELDMSDCRAGFHNLNTLESLKRPVERAPESDGRGQEPSDHA